MLVRGDVGPAGKPRPCLLVQRSSTLEGAAKLTICPLTSMIKVESISRPLIHPSIDTGLRVVSQVQVDWVFTYRRDRIGQRIGSIDASTMRDVDTALRRWLDL